MPPNQESFSFFSLLTMLGGLCIFLYGLDVMTINLKRSAGQTLKLILEKAMDNPIRGLFIGALVTGIVNSSSAVTSILVSFVQSGLITFERTIAVILGSNIGSTVTGQIIAFKITKWSLPIILLGYLIEVSARRTKTKNISQIIIGFGLLFLGLDFMSESMKALRDLDFFLELMRGLENVALGIVVGAVFTALIHSSGAFTGIMIGMASQGLLSSEASIPIILGSNIGTCLTAVLASLKTGSDAKRVAAAHVLFNVIGVVLFAFWVPELHDLVLMFTPKDDIARFVANVQTIFNVLSAFLCLPFIKQLEWLSKKIIPDDSRLKDKKYYLPRVSGFSKVPEPALIQSRDAIRCLKNIVKEMLLAARQYFVEQRSLQAATISELRSDHLVLRKDLLDFLSRLSRQGLSYSQTSDILNQAAVINEVEHVAHRLMVTIENMENKTPRFDEQDFAGLNEYFLETVKCFSKSCNAFLNDSTDECLRLLQKIDDLKPFETEFRNKCIERIYKNTSKDSKDHEYDRINLEVLEELRSINSTSKRIAQILIDERERLKSL